MNFIIKIELYPFDILVSINETDKQVRQKIIKLIPNISQNDLSIINIRGKAKAVMFSNGGCLLRLKEYKNNSNWNSILSHEIFHITCFIMDRVGIKYSKNSDEAYAYLIQYITKKILEKLND